MCPPTSYLLPTTLINTYIHTDIHTLNSQKPLSFHFISFHLITTKYQSTKALKYVLTYYILWKFFASSTLHVLKYLLPVKESKNRIIFAVKKGGSTTLEVSFVHFVPANVHVGRIPTFPHFHVPHSALQPYNLTISHSRTYAPIPGACGHAWCGRLEGLLSWYWVCVYLYLYRTVPWSGYLWRLVCGCVGVWVCGCWEVGKSNLQGTHREKEIERESKSYSIQSHSFSIHLSHLFC